MNVEPYTRPVRTVQWEGRDSYSPSTLFLKKAVTGLAQDSIVKVPPITNFKHGLSPNNCL